jgi:hypothetical protein
VWDSIPSMLEQRKVAAECKCLEQNRNLHEQSTSSLHVPNVFA